MLNFIDKLRHSIYYKCCGIICGTLTFFSILFWSFLPKYLGQGEGALLVLPLLVASVIVALLDILVFVSVTVISLVTKNYDDKTNIISDIGYVLSLCFIIFIIISVVFRF